MSTTTARARFAESVAASQLDPIELAASDMPEGWTIELHVERGAATVYLFDPEYDRQEVDYDPDGTWQQHVTYAVKWATVEAAKRKEVWK